MKIPKQMPDLADLNRKFTYNKDSGIVTHIGNCRFGKHFNGQLVGHMDGQGYLQTWAIDGYYLLHRLVYYMTTGEQPPVVDHKNRVRSDNRFLNLRAYNTCWNAKNREDVNLYPGIRVKQLKYKTKYTARITIKGKETYLGTFNTLEEAIAAKQQAESIYHGKDFSTRF